MEDQREFTKLELRLIEKILTDPEAMKIAKEFIRQENVGMVDEDQDCI